MGINQAAIVGEKSALSSKRYTVFGAVGSYIEVLKPLPTVLLAFIGAATAVIAGGGQLLLKLLLVLAAVLVAAAGANGLTNYLDRDIDARMRRTCFRALPSQAISPPARYCP